MVQRLTIAIPWVLALVVGLALSVLSAPVMMTVLDWHKDWSDRNSPPATLKMYSVERLGKDSLRVTLLVKRHDDCLMVRALAYTGKTLQTMHPAVSFEREDGSLPQSYPVGIAVISKPWLLTGVYGDKLAVALYYECGNRIVKAPLLTGDVPP